jgi:DNA-binding Lrp family transcriptional regulator
MAGEPISGYLLVEAAKGDINAVAAQLRSVDGVQFAHALLGPTDIIAYVETPDWDSFNALLNGSIRALETSGLARQVETRLTVKPSAGSFGSNVQSPPRGSAWIFLDLDQGEPADVVAKLEAIDDVVVAHCVIGGCDIMVYLECEDWGELRTVLDTQVRTIPEVVRTDTRPVLMRRASRARAS